MNRPQPSRATVLRNLAIALAVAVVLLFTLVLPAEFGRDPTGVGKLLGLTALHAGGNRLRRQTWQRRPWLCRTWWAATTP